MIYDIVSEIAFKITTGRPCTTSCSVMFIIILCVCISFIPSVASSSTFTIRHFAGDVVYDIYSLLNANADTLADDIIATFNSKVSTIIVQ